LIGPVVSTVENVIARQLAAADTASFLRQLTFPRYAVMRFVCALDSIFALAAIVRELFDHHIGAARDVATGGGAHGHGLADVEFVEHGVPQFELLQPGFFQFRRYQPFLALGTGL
jgi:hypothetical protein